MRLTMAMFFGKKPYGYLYRGKHRKLKPVTPLQLSNLKMDYERTERNMLILRYPYLTVEQSEGHKGGYLNKKQKRISFLTKIQMMRNEKFAKHISLAEELGHLRVKDAWD